MEKLRAHSPSLAERNTDTIARLFPSVITESRDSDGGLIRAIDFDRLRQELSGHVIEGPRERYQLDWPGKREALFLARSGQADSAGTRLVANTESNGRLHSDWLSMMYPRLKLARNLLADDGAIFVSIDSTEQANLTRLLVELMGEDNFRANIVWQKRYTRSNNTRDFTTVVENIVAFSRSERLPRCMRSTS